MGRWRYQLERIQLVNRPLGWGTATDVDDYDWVPDLEERLYDLSAVSVWPHQLLHPVRDAVVIEHVGQPGRYIHRIRNDPRVLDCRPAETVETALMLPSAEAGWRWIDEVGASSLADRTPALPIS